MHKTKYGQFFHIANTHYIINLCRCRYSTRGQPNSPNICTTAIEHVSDPWLKHQEG